MENLRGRVGRWGLLTLAALAVLAVLAAPASAATVQTDCAHFGSTLTAATNDETIVLTGLCTGSNASFALPSVTGLTIEGAATGTNGFDGTGVASPALHGTGNGFTLRNLTFENYNLNASAAVVLSPNAGVLPTVDSDRFLNNSVTASFTIGPSALEVEDGGSSSCPHTGSLTIRNSTFSGNRTTLNGSGATAFGGAAAVLFFCQLPHTVTVAITGNTFTDNSISTTGSHPTALGAGLYVANGNSGILTGSQAANVFRGNSIAQSAGTANGIYGGGGEFVGSINLTSVGDEFIANSLPGPSGLAASSEGGGLSVLRGQCNFSAAVPPAAATATNLVSTDNTIAAPSSGGSVEGAGVYAGCAASTGTGGFHLTLINSTVSGNAGPGGTAGVDGEATDHLTLENTIVHGDTGAGSSELGGFGSISAANSDVCTGGSSTAPFAGTGNICADPRLVNVSAGDVHETAASPTIDRGSNAFVPPGVTKDFYGAPRMIGTRQRAAIVDIGAAEFQKLFPPRAKVVHEKATHSGVKLTISCAGAASQVCTGKVMVTTKRHKHQVVVARGRYRITGGKRATLTIKLRPKGKKLLKSLKKLSVRVKVTQRNSAGKQVTISLRELTIKHR